MIAKTVRSFWLLSYHFLKCLVVSQNDLLIDVGFKIAIFDYIFANRLYIVVWSCDKIIIDITITIFNQISHFEL